jgi:hypothetical protein
MFRLQKEWVEHRSSPLPEEARMATTATRKRTKAAVITGPHPRGGWQNKIADSSRAANLHSTKEAAEAKGRSMARSRKVEHIIQDQHGKIQERNSYGNDPVRRAG